MIGLLDRLARPLLLALDPEDAHRLAIRALKHLPLPPLPQDDKRLATRAFGLNFPNPVGIAAGFDKHAEVPDALLRAGLDVKMSEGTPEQLAAMVSLLRPENAHLYGRIVSASEDLTRPLLTRVISEGVHEGVFDTFDPAGVADMILGLAARVNTNVVQIFDAPDESARARAVDVLTKRFKLHGIAVDRILGLPDGSVTVLRRAQVAMMTGAAPRDD